MAADARKQRRRIVPQLVVSPSADDRRAQVEDAGTGNEPAGPILLQKQREQSDWAREHLGPDRKVFLDLTDVAANKEVDWRKLLKERGVQKPSKAAAKPADAAAASDDPLLLRGRNGRQENMNTWTRMLAKLEATYCVGAGSDEESESDGWGDDSDSDAEEEGGEGSSGEEEASEDDDEEEEERQQDDAGWLDGSGSGSGSEDEAPEEEMAGSGGAGRLAARRASAAAAGEADGEEAAGGSSDEEGGGGQAAAAPAAADDEMAALEREYEQMQQDEQTAMAGLKERAARERKKALAVQAQKAVWQRGLEARILLQRALAGGNRLPQGEMQEAAAASSADLAAAFGGLAADASALLQDLLHLLGALAGQNPAVAEAAAAAGASGQAAAAAEGSGGRHKRARGDEAGSEGQQQDGAPPGADALWGQVEAAYAAFGPFRDASIDRWHRKTTLTAGGATLRGGQLKALNQSVSTQVAQLMQDPGKMLERTRLPRSAQQQHAARLLCPDPEAAPAAKRGRWSDDEEPTANGMDTKLEEERDPETYDDAEFYQTLLREFLEGSADAGGANWHSGPKHRKAVDRRASKGRKLRYHVHNKLVNFMTPVELEAPQFAAQLFSNLFGGAGSRGAKK